jgi:hypothetical protein
MICACTSTYNHEGLSAYFLIRHHFNLLHLTHPISSSSLLFSSHYLPSSPLPSAPLAPSTGPVPVPADTPVPHLTTNMKHQTILSKFTDMKSVICASYLCDFGNVIQGLKKKKQFKIFNATAGGDVTL